MTERETAMQAFLDSAGWGAANHHPLPGDASTRRYIRLKRGDDSAMLMDAPPGAEAPACPPDATPEDRAKLGYNALARLAGPNLTAFAGLSDALTQRGFAAPRILASDIPEGFLLLEDLGDDLVARIVPEPEHEGQIYALAIDVLAALYRSSFAREVTRDGQVWPVLDYDLTAYRAELSLFLDWYLGQYSGSGVTSEARDAWDAAWSDALTPVFETPSGLVLRDFHAENLLYRSDREELAMLGLIDFQDALFGHPAYDLVSLLEDARRDVDPGLVAPLKTRFFDKSGLQDRDRFDGDYAVIGAQRNAKILGIFVRLAKRDGKPGYLDLLPRVARHFVGDLDHPRLAAIKAWCETYTPNVFEEAQS